IDDQHAAKAELRGRGGRGSRVVRLHAAERDDRVGIVRARLREHVLELSNLVPAEPERNGIVALHQKARSRAQRRAKARHFLDRRRTGEQRHARTLGHRYSSDDGGPPDRAIWSARIFPASKRRALAIILSMVASKSAVGFR